MEMKKHTSAEILQAYVDGKEITYSTKYGKPTINPDIKNAAAAADCLIFLLNNPEDYTIEIADEITANEAERPQREEMVGYVEAYVNELRAKGDSSYFGDEGRAVFYEISRRIMKLSKGME